MIHTELLYESVVECRSCSDSGRSEEVNIHTLLLRFLVLAVASTHSNEMKTSFGTRPNQWRRVLPWLLPLYDMGSVVVVLPDPVPIWDTLQGDCRMIAEIGVWLPGLNAEKQSVNIWRRLRQKPSLHSHLDHTTQESKFATAILLANLQSWAHLTPSFLLSSANHVIRATVQPTDSSGSGVNNHDSGPPPMHQSLVELKRMAPELRSTWLPLSASALASYVIPSLSQPLLIPCRPWHCAPRSRNV